MKKIFILLCFCNSFNLSAQVDKNYIDAEDLSQNTAHPLIILLLGLNKEVISSALVIYTQKGNTFGHFAQTQQYSHLFFCDSFKMGMDYTLKIDAEGYHTCLLPFKTNEEKATLTINLLPKHIDYTYINSKPTPYLSYPDEIGIYPQVDNIAEAKKLMEFLNIKELKKQFQTGDLTPDMLLSYFSQPFVYKIPHGRRLSRFNDPDLARLRKCNLIAYAGPIYKKEKGELISIFTNSCFVNFSDEAEMTTIQKILAAQKLKIRSTMSGAPHSYFVEAAFDIGAGINDIIGRLLNIGLVESAGPNCASSIKFD